jgi:hypothetical protein
MHLPGELKLNMLLLLPPPLPPPPLLLLLLPPCWFYPVVLIMPVLLHLLCSPWCTLVLQQGAELLLQA